MTEVLRIGCGAGLANDRFDASVELTENGNLDVLVLECLAERTIALGQTRELAEPGTGYDPTLERRIRSLLGPLAAHGTQLVTNLGSANQIAAGELVARVATDMGGRAYRRPHRRRRIRAHRQECACVGGRRGRRYARAAGVRERLPGRRAVTSRGTAVGHLPNAARI